MLLLRARGGHQLHFPTVPKVIIKRSDCAQRRQFPSQGGTASQEECSILRKDPAPKGITPPENFRTL